MAGGIRPVVEHPVLHIDEAGEHEFGQHLTSMLRLLHETEEYPIRFRHLAAMDQGQPVPQTLAERTFQALRLLVRPVHNGRGWRPGGQLGSPSVVARRLENLLVPDVETGRDVPDGLGHGQAGRLGRQQLDQVERGPGAEQTVIASSSNSSSGRPWRYRS